MSGFNNSIIVVSGPTASGKTSLSIQLAKKYNGEVINFDSLLFYKELNIGTAKPTEEEKDGVPHHLVSMSSIKKALNASDYIKIAEPLIKECHSRNKLVILVGGSGFYLQALLKGMYNSPTSPQSVKDRSEELYKSKGIQAFREILKENDQKSYELYHENDHYRLRRAVEHFWTTGTPFSDARKNMEENKGPTPVEINAWNVWNIYIDIPKEDHFPIIQKRTLEMLDNGLADEVKGLLDQGFSKELKPLKSIGYKETIDYLEGSLSSKEELIERININTRRLAKSQRTWFKKQDVHKYLILEERDKLLSECDSFLQMHLIQGQNSI